MKLTWPRRHPYNKRYLQVSVGRTETALLLNRVTGLVLKWEPRLWAKGVNVPPRLLAEQRRLAGIVARGGVDWSIFPDWAKGDK
jgi:hypothetical protein